MLRLGEARVPYLKRLIIVEDELLIADMIREMVEEIGWIVDGIAYSVEEGHALLDAHQPALAILDIRLGRVTSASIASLCHQRGTQIIYITGYADIDQQGPPGAVLAKPFTSGEIAEALDHAEATLRERLQQ